MVAAHLHAQDVEVRFGRLDGRTLLAVEERNFDDRQVLRVGQQVPRLRAVASVAAVGQIAADPCDLRVMSRI